jgi:hypothetical protein
MLRPIQNPDDGTSSFGWLFGEANETTLNFGFS